MIDRIKSWFGRKPQTDNADKGGDKSLVAHFKKLKDVLAAIRKPKLDRAEIARRMFPRSIYDMVVTSCSVKDGKTSFTTGGKVWAFDEATQTPLPVKRYDNASPSAIAQFKSMHGVGADIPDEIWEFYAQSFITWQVCAQFAQHPLINRVCAVRGEDAVAVGYEISYADAGSKDIDGNGKENDDKDRTDYLAALKKETKRMGIDEVLRLMDYKKCVFGIGIAIPTFDSDIDMSLPFNIDAKGLETYTGFTVVDPYWLMPMFDHDAAANPASKHFFQPTWWKLPTGKMIHRSWCFTSVYSHVADIYKPSYIYGGVPLTQMIYERVFAADKCANEAPLLALTKRLLVVDANIQQILADPKHVKDLMDVVTYCRNNWGVMFKQPTANINQIDTSLGEYDQLIMTQYQLVASIAQMPATKLLKVTPTGFQSTGEYEWKDWAQSLIDIQEMEFTPLLERHFQLLTRKRGKVVPITVTFNPIDAPTEKEKAEIENLKAQTNSTLLTSGAVTVEEVRDAMRADENSPYTGIDKKPPQNENAEMVKKLMDKMGDEDDADGETSETGDEWEAFDDAEFEQKHKRDKGGRFTRTAGQGLKHQLVEYRKEKGVQKTGAERYASPSEAKKQKEFEFPKLSDTERFEQRTVGTEFSEIYNGGSREPRMRYWKKNALSVPRNPEYSLDKIGEDAKFERCEPRWGMKTEKKEVKDKKTGRVKTVETKRAVKKVGEPVYRWKIGGKFISDGEAFELESAMANGGMEICLALSSSDVVIRKDFANGRGQVCSYSGAGEGKKQIILDRKSAKFNKEMHIKHVNSVFDNADRILDEITDDFDGRDDDFGVLAYFQFMTTMRVGSSPNNKNLGALEIKKEHVKVDGDTIHIEADMKNGRWITDLENKPLAEWVKKRLSSMSDGDKLFGGVDYSKYSEYLREIGKKAGVETVKKADGKLVGLGSHDMRRLSASVYAAQLVDEITIDPRKDKEGYVKAIEEVIRRTAKHINDKDAAMGFRSYIAPNALWKNAMFIYSGEERFVPSAGR